MNLLVQMLIHQTYSIPRGGGGEPKRHEQRTTEYLVFPAEAGVNLLRLSRYFWIVGIPRGGGGEPERVDKVETKI